MNAYYCAECVVSWSPHQTMAGACPACGSGTVRRQEHPSPDSLTTPQVRRIELDAQAVHEHGVAVQLAGLEAIGAMQTVQPVRRAA